MIHSFTRHLVPFFAVAAIIFDFQTARSAEVRAFRLASIFGDNMVLQQQKSVPIWGWCEPDAEVTVNFDAQSKSTRADADGKWLVKLGKLTASTKPQSLVITWHWRGQTPDSSAAMDSRMFSKTLTNILVGEVWLASGQSNMEKPIGKQPGQKPCFNYEQELAAANYPQIRIFQVEKTVSVTPLDDLEKFHGWQECDSNALDSTSFSAAAYFFGREIHTNLNVPVGLVESSWGGTRIEPWTPPAGFEQVASQKKFAAMKIVAADIPDTRKVAPAKPTVIYNAMIAPLAGFAMRGVIWYQGESNLMGGTNDYDYLDYADKMAALVGGWRQIWDEGSFPFYFVQIAPFRYCSGSIQRVPSMESLPKFWTIQSHAARRIKNTGMAVTTDLVNNLNDIHPRDKQDVGHRLALLALNKTYGEKNLVCSGPTFKKMIITGNKAVLKFDNVDGGLVSKDGKPLTWFTIAGADGKFVSAEATIVGDAVEICAAGIEKPVAVRFAWSEIAQPNLCNKAGLPAEPFAAMNRGSDGAK